MAHLELRNALISLVRDTRGSAAVFLGLGLIPVFMLGWAALEYAEYSTVTTRVQQSQVQALYAIAKEGRDYAADEAGTQGEAWMGVNTGALGRSAASYSTAFAVTSSGVTAQTTYSDDTLAHMFPSSLLPVTSMRALFYAQPLEIAMALDASASFRNLHSVVTSAVEGVTNEVFGEAGRADDVWVSMNFAAAFVNIGSRYAKRLINPASAVPYYEGVIGPALEQAPRSSAIAPLLEKAKSTTLAMLANEYPNVANNLAKEGAPGFDIGTVCVYRPKLNDYQQGGGGQTGDVGTYVENVFEVPENGFDLVQGINFPMLGQVPVRGQYIATQIPAISISSSNNLNAQATGYQNVTLDQYALLSRVPPSAYGLRTQDKSSNIANAYATNWKQWGNISGLNRMYATSETTIYPMVSVPGGCPRPPMVIGAQEAQPLLEAVALWGTAPASSPDEAFAWALRALEPNYADIWEISGYPGAYEKDGGDHEKRIIFVTDNDMMTQGYGSKNWGETDLITPLCRAAIARGIKIYTIFTANPSAKSQAALDVCSPSPSQQFIMSSISASKGATFVEYMKNAAKRKYRVKIAKY